MEKGFRTVICPEPCGKKLRLKINREHYGKTLEVTCPACSLKFTVTIPVPALRPAGKASEFPEEEDDPFGILDKINKIFGKKS